MSTSRKAEISMEFIIFMGILLAFFVFYFGIIGVKTRDVNESRVFANAQDIVNQIAYEINTAARMEGYYREFTISQKLVDRNGYSVEIDKDARIVVIRWDGSNVISNIITDQISGNVSPGTNRIKNQGGLIIIES
ncbi:MAG: hypothetical protein ABIE55_03610 [Candidatus Aenigmatarchaeota archaeon]